MSARIIPFPPAKVKRLVEPVWPHGNSGAGTGLAWWLAFPGHNGPPHVVNGFNPPTQYFPLFERYQGKPARRRKVDPPEKPA